MKNKKHLIYWIIPIAFCYLFTLIGTIFVISNIDGLIESKLFNYWIIYLIFLACISFFGTYKIFSWVKSGKL